MDLSCLSNASNKDFSYLVNKNTSGEKKSEEKSCFRRVFYEGVCGANLPNNHEPLEASHGARIMANEYKREKEQLEKNIAALKAECNDKDKEIAFLKETLSEKEKEIAHLKEKLCHVQQHGQTKEFDFVKQMATIDEELRKAKKNIDEATETLVKNKSAEVEELHSERQTFNGEDYFDLKPSWFDTLAKNVGCPEVVFPVKARGLAAHKSESASQKSSNEVFKAANYFDLPPSWFDTLSNNGGCLEIENRPVTARDLEANKTDDSNSKFTKVAKAETYFDLQPSWFDTLANNAGCLEVKNYAVTARELEREILKYAVSSVV